jgi:hypothetical protein
MLVPDFIGKKEDSALEWSDRNSIEMETSYVTSNNPSHYIGMIIKQTALPFMDVRQIGKSGFKIEVVEKLELETQSIDCSLSTNKDDEYCIIPSFIGQNTSVLRAWFNLRSVNVNVSAKEITTSDPLYDIDKAGLITKQSVSNASVYNYINKDFVYEFMAQ